MKKLALTFILHGYVKLWLTKDAIILDSGQLHKKYSSHYEATVLVLIVLNSDRGVVVVEKCCTCFCVTCLCQIITDQECNNPREWQLHRKRSSQPIEKFAYIAL